MQFSGTKTLDDYVQSVRGKPFFPKQFSDFSTTQKWITITGTVMGIVFIAYVVVTLSFCQLSIHADACAIPTSFSPVFISGMPGVVEMVPLVERIPNNPAPQFETVARP